MLAWRSGLYSDLSFFELLFLGPLGVTLILYTDGADFTESHGKTFKKSVSKKVLITVIPREVVLIFLWKVL